MKAKKPASEENRILIDVARLDPEGETFEGEVDAINLEEEFIHPFGGIRYRLTAQLFNTELLVRGTLAQDFTFACSKCGKDFDTTVEVGDFETSREVDPKAETEDMTEEVREAIVLAMPLYPVCDENCKGILTKAEAPRDNRWGALDALNEKKEEEQERR